MKHSYKITQSEIERIAETLVEKLSGSPRKRWLTLQEAMEYARVKSQKTIRAWINEGYIYGSKRTGSWIIDRQSIDDWFLSDS